MLATSLSLIAVFLPVAFMGGIVGRFMYSFGVTMAFAIAVSLLVAFSLTPMLASRWLRAKDVAQPGHGSRQKGFYARVERGYLRLLDFAMAHRWLVVVTMVLVFVSIVPLFMAVNKNFLPDDDESQFQVIVRAPEGANLDATQKILESIATQVRKLDGVATTVVTIGDDPQRTLNLGSVYVQLSDPKKRKEDQFKVMQRVRDQIVPQYQALKLRAQVVKVSAFGGAVNNDIQFWIGGPDLAKLDQYAQVLKTELAKVPGTTDVDTNFIVGKPELGVRIDRDKAADLGVRVQDIASSLNVLVGGQKATSYFEAGEEYEVHVRAGEADRNDPAAIAAMEVPAATRATVPLRDVVSLEEATGPSLINRLNRRRQVMVTANMKPGFSQQVAIDTLNKTAVGLKMPAGLLLRPRGAVARAGQGGGGLRDGVPAVDHLHVPDPRGAVRELAAAGHDPDVAAADGAVRAAVDPGAEPVAEHLRDARPVRAVRHREEERDPADRPHQRPAGAGDAAGGGDPRGEPRPACGRS